MLNTSPYLTYFLGCNSCGHMSEFMTDGDEPVWACDKCAASDLELTHFMLHGDWRDFSPLAVEEYLKNWMPGDGLELIIYMDQLSHYDIADARESLFDVVDVADYEDYVVNRLIGGREIDDIRYYLDEDQIVSDFEVEHDVIEFWMYKYIFI